MHYGGGTRPPGLFLLSAALYIGFIAYPIAWTFGRLAPDMENEPNVAPNLLTPRELFQTVLGLFLVVSSIRFMHWVIWSPAAGLINLLAVFVIPASAVVLTVIAVIIGWAAVIHYFIFAHPPHSP